MMTQAHIDHFSKALKIILDAEVRLGNEIVETSTGWPTEDAVTIFLKLPFLDTYKIENVDYRDVDDRHYWKAEYIDKSTNHLLACRFG